MELAEKLVGIMQFKNIGITKTQNEIKNDTAQKIRQEIKECVLAMQKNELLFNMEQNLDLIDAHIYQRESLQVRYNYLIRRAKHENIQVWDITKNIQKVNL